MNTNKVYIILLNYNGWKDTIECLESVLKNDYENYQIIVVDNDSPNNSMEYIINWAEGKQEVIYDENSQLKHLSQPFEPKPLEYVYYRKEEALKGGDKEKELSYKNPLIFIQSGENGGFAAGNNIGMEYALAKDDFEYIWLLNNDTVIERDSLINMVNRFQRKVFTEQIGIMGSKLMYYYNPQIIQAMGGVYSDWKARGYHLGGLEKDIGQYDNDEFIKDVSYPVGASMLLSKQFLQDVGLMNEEYFLYYEELDWMERAKARRHRLDICYKSKVYHKEGGSIGTDSDIIQQSDLSIFYLARSHKRFVFRYKNTLFIALFYLRIILNLLKHFLKNRKKQFYLTKKAVLSNKVF